MDIFFTSLSFLRKINFWYFFRKKKQFWEDFTSQNRIIRYIWTWWMNIKRWMLLIANTFFSIFYFRQERKKSWKHDIQYCLLYELLILWKKENLKKKKKIKEKCFFVCSFKFLSYFRFLPIKNFVIFYLMYIFQMLDISFLNKGGYPYYKYSRWFWVWFSPFFS